MTTSGPQTIVPGLPYTYPLRLMSITSLDRVEQNLSMSSKLVSWSFFYSVACLMGTAVSLLMQSKGPLVVAGTVSFGALFYLYGASGYSNRLFKGANLLTLSRLILTLSLFAVPFLPNSGLFILLISLFILIADGFDGWLARRRNEVTEFGEYFDKETDAFFLLTLCVLAYGQGKLGLWILLPGLLRYIFVVVMAAAQPDEGKEYRSKWARIIFVVMVGSLLSVFVVPVWLYAPAVTIATTALVLSFAHYFKWIWVQKRDRRNTSTSKTWFIAIGGFLFINTLLFLPSFITNLATSSFLPIPGLKDPTATMHWTRGWYDHFLHYIIRRPNQDVFRICVDLVALISLMYGVRSLGSGVRGPGASERGAWFTRRVVVPAIIGLFLYEIYDALVHSFFHRSGVMIEDAQYWLNLYYILRDALSPEQAPIFICAVTGFVLLIWTLPRILDTIYNALRTVQPRMVLSTVSIAFWCTALFFWYWFGSANPDPTLRSIVGKMGVNISDSVEMQQTIAANKAQPIDPVYTTFASSDLVSKPDIYLILIESYGSVIHENPDLKSLHSTRISHLEEALHTNGWLTASTQSSAPVSGGLSWLSMSSTLSGMVIDNKAQYTAFLRHIDTYPHLVHYLKNQGYSTITLQPPNRPRPGLPIENPYQFDHTVFFEELGYTGKPYGVWIVPDQYSLEFTHENYIKDENKPSFLFFETATTHAPWVPPPPYLEDWRALNDFQPESTPMSEARPASPSIFKKIRDSYVNRFYKEQPSTVDSYYATISYDFEVIKEFILNKDHPNSLFIIMGDHQPPLLKSTTFDTPLHVITKDSTLFDRLPAFNFTPGLNQEVHQNTELTHAGIYSMLIELLTTPEASSQPMPSSRFRPQGISPSIIP